MSNVLKKLFPRWNVDAVDQGIAELLAFDKPLAKARAAVKKAEATFKEAVKARIATGGELADPPELGLDLAELGRQSRLLEEAFTEKRDEIAKLLSAGSAQRKDRLAEIKDAIKTIAYDRHIAFVRAFLNFARAWGIDLREIRFPTKTNSGVMPLPAPVVFEPDTGDHERLRTEAAETPAPALMKQEELAALRREQDRLKWKEIQPAEQAVDALLDQARREENKGNHI